MTLPIIRRGPIDDLAKFEAFAARPPAGSPATPDRVTPDVFLRRIFYGNLPVQMHDGEVVRFWGFFDPSSGVERLPSETIRVTEGQIVHVQLNPSRNTHTIHHHGIEPTTFNDGVGHHSFEVDLRYTYQWKASNAGTYFYHCHKNTVLHVELGMYGGLIIDPPSGRGFVRRVNEEIRYDVEAYWLLDDVDPRWHTLGHSAGMGMPFGEDVGLNSFDPIYHLISGVPAHETRTDPRVTVNCDVGQTVLLRVLNGSYSQVKVTIEGIDGEVIEVDGRTLGHEPESRYSQPFAVPADTTFELSPAQRWGILAKPMKAGSYRVRFDFVNQWANRGKVTTVETFINVTGANKVHFVELQGRDRFTTNANIAHAAFPESVEHVVIANGMNWPDALAGSALAGAMNAPLLLVQPNAVPSVIEREMRRMAADSATIIGGAASVSGNVRTHLQSLVRSGRVHRAGGRDRYHVAADVAVRVKSAVEAAGGAFEKTAFVVSGEGFADALSASALAAHRKWPILLTTANTLPAATENALRGLGIERVIIVGGPKSVSAAVETRLQSIVGELNVERVDGLNRYDTSLEMANFSVANGLSWKNPALAAGDKFPDALAGGVLQGLKGSVLVLSPGASLYQGLATQLLNRKDQIESLTYLGGELTLTPQVRSQVKGILA